MKLRSRPAQIFAAREGRWLVVAGEDRHVVPAAAVSLLRCCTVPRTLAEHEAAFVAAERMGRDRVPAVRALLADLVRRGLIAEAASAEEAAAIRTIVIPTRARSPILERCQTSFAENARMFGREVRFVVSEDGAANPRREVWVRRLAAVAPEGVARFLLFGDPGMDAASKTSSASLASYGANRNLLLLETAGEPVLTVDDDMVCEWRRSPEYQPGLAVSARNPAERWLHESMDAARGSAAPEPFDVLGRFGAGLGPMGESVISEAPVPVRVAIAQAGVCGDAGTDSPLGRLLARGAARERWLERPGLWRTRAVTAVARRETLVTAPHWMTACAAMDGRLPLVPFPPMDRFDDRTFATLLWMTRHDWAIRHVPWSVWHEPVPAREFAADALTAQAGVFRTGEAVLAFLYHAKPPSLAAAAEWLGEAAAWDEATFVRFVAALRRKGVEKEIAILREAIAEHGGKPEWWAGELRAVIAVLEETLAGERLMAGSAGLQGYLGAFAELLRHWPAMWECARGYAGERV
ncbi:MAG: hypothetical protein R2729_30780 [Bryobacteraceae bacterium]